MEQKFGAVQSDFKEATKNKDIKLIKEFRQEKKKVERLTFKKKKSANDSKLGVSGDSMQISMLTSVAPSEISVSVGAYDGIGAFGEEVESPTKILHEIVSENDEEESKS